MKKETYVSYQGCMDQYTRAAEKRPIKNTSVNPYYLPNQIRVLMIVRQYYPWVGGTEQQARKLAKALSMLGVKVQISTGWWFRNTPSFEYIDDIPVRRNFTAWGSFGIKGLRKFSGYLYMITLAIHLWRSKKSYDLIHIHGLNYHSFVGILMAKWLNKKSLVKVACSGKGSDILKMKRNNLIPGTREMFPTTRSCNCVIALNQSIADEFVEEGFLPDKIVCLPNGVAIPSDKPDSFKSLSNNKREVKIVFAGRLHPQKGPDILIESLNILAKEHPELDWRIDLLGQGVLQPSLENRVKECGLIDRVTFQGAVTNVNDYLVSADIFVLPSRAEGMSNALLEAMAMGLPCVATDVPGNNELIAHNQDGLLTTAEDPYDMSLMLSRLIKDVALRKKLGQAALKKVIENYSIEVVAKSYIQLYNNLLDGSSLSIH